MNNSFKNNNKKGKNNLAFFTFQRGAFFISTILLILAITSAYPLYIEGETAQKNAQLALDNFENIALKKEKFEVQNTVKAYESENTVEKHESYNTTRTSEPQVTNEERINFDEIHQVTPKSIEKPEVEYIPIAKLNIEKINLEISVLSEWSYELLDISVNKFSGPEPNEPGNFIIIGHNYLNGEHFGNLNLMEIEDFIDLTDLSGRKITYEVYEILIIKPDEVEKLMTKEAQTLTLVTCDTNLDLRLIIKSRVIN